MKIRRFNEDMESGDFISIQEVKDIFSHLYDTLEDVKISYKWLYGNSEYHVSEFEGEEDEEIQVIMIEGQMPLDDTIPFYADYGVDFQSVSIKDLSKAKEVIDEIIDASKHLEPEGYQVNTQIYNYMFVITISKIGTLLL